MKAVARLLSCEVTIAFSIGPAELADPASSASSLPGPAQDDNVRQQADSPPSTLAVVASSTRPTSAQPMASLPSAVLEYLCQPPPTCALTTYTLPAHGTKAIQETHVRRSTCLAIIGAVSIKEPKGSMIVPQQPWGPAGHAVSSTILIDPRLLIGVKVSPNGSHPSHKAYFWTPDCSCQLKMAMSSSQRAV